MAATESQDLTNPLVTALSREGYDFSLLESAPGVVRGEIRREGKTAGQLIAVQYEPESDREVAVETRVGTLGNPTVEQRLAQTSADQLARARDSKVAPVSPPRPWSSIVLTGRWIDLEPAVAQAGVTKQNVDLAVESVDRWRYATFFDLRTLGAEEARLIVIGDRESKAGPREAYIRIGLFGHSSEEEAYLNRLRAALTKLGGEERLPGAR